MQTTEKLSIANQPGPHPQRGWSRVGAENSSNLYKKGFLKDNTTEELRDARVSQRELDCLPQSVDEV
jgi:hypothetical protein